MVDATVDEEALKHVSVVRQQAVRHRQHCQCLREDNLSRLLHHNCPLSALILKANKRRSLFSIKVPLVCKGRFLAIRLRVDDSTSKAHPCEPIGRFPDKSLLIASSNASSVISSSSSSSLLFNSRKTDQRQNLNVYIASSNFQEERLYSTGETECFCRR